MTQYDPHQWTSHLFDIEGSMVREILGRVSACAIWSVIIVALYLCGPEICKIIAIPQTGHALVGTSLGLLLVFRTNSSYDRFWEGRKQWGGIVNECRNLTRQASVWLAADQPLMREVVSWTIAFPFATMQRLRSSPGLGTLLPDVPVSDVEQVEASHHVPLAVARAITSRLLVGRQRGLIDEIQLNALDQNVQLLVDYCGACERIRSTPLPFSYAVHLRRVMIVYCFTLPQALVESYGWSTIPATLLIAYIMFGIEEIGVEIEDPFGIDANDLPLKTICAGIETALRDVLDEGVA